MLNKDLKQMRKEIEQKERERKEIEQKRRREEKKEKEEKEKKEREQESYILQEDMRKLQKQLTHITNLLQTQNAIKKIYLC